LDFKTIQAKTLGVTHNMPEKDREVLYCYAKKVPDMRKFTRMYGII